MHRGQVTPLIKDMDVRALAVGVVLTQAHLAGIGPDQQLLLRQRQLQAQVMPFGTFFATADALAAPDLVRKTAALAGLRSERLQAQTLAIREFAQTGDGLIFRAVDAVHLPKLLRD